MNHYKSFNHHCCNFKIGKGSHMTVKLGHDSELAINNHNISHGYLESTHTLSRRSHKN